MSAHRDREPVPQVRVHGVDDVRVDRVDAPRPGPRDVVVEVAQCGICGTDLSYVAMGGLPGAPSPMPLGHEFAGVVAEVGGEVRHLAVGDRVVVNPEGNANGIGGVGGVGAFTPRVLVRGAADDADAVLRLPDHLSFEHGALVEPMSVGLHAVHQSKVRPGDAAVVFGAGTIGLAIVLGLRASGVERIASVDLAPERLALAERLGAVPVRGDAPDLAARLRELHGDASVMGAPAPATDVWFEATGAGPVFERMLRMTRVGARIVVVGVHKAPVRLDLVNMLIREQEIVASIAYPREFPEVLGLIASGALDPMPLVTHRFGLSQFDEAFATARDASRAVKVLVDCQR
ncbi:MAG: alcohol dehydrogenase catalytic domain-containing protein [Myxococcales bacterium]|nr:alcohol dehydrogenase catalytic domain-containing protein [Myxococcales bacterium]